jgi:hypothetical protein
LLKHIKRLTFTVLASCALALGGAVVATASTRTAAHHQRAHHGRITATEQSEEGTESTQADGPGGHEDEPGAEVDHQFEGEE